MYGSLEYQSQPVPDTKRQAWLGAPQGLEMPFRWPAIGEPPIPYCRADTLAVYEDDGTLLMQMSLGNTQTLMPHDEIFCDVKLDWPMTNTGTTDDTGASKAGRDA